VAKRKTTEQKAVEARITESLDLIGREVIATSSRNSKVSKIQKIHLRESGNFRVKPYNVLNLSQYKYGKYNTPKGVPTPTDRSNITDTPLVNAINEIVDPEIDVLVRDLIAMIVSPIVKK
tara:strand:+ start:126 stop:485 length:360 start_codon:yes stop_codon:yes gene_type:complete